MARLDVFALDDGSYVLDCQAEELSHLNTRFTVPLVPTDEAPKPASRLNPIFVIDGSRHIMVTQYAATIPVREMTRHVASFQHEHFTVMAALDMLISGY